MSINRLIIMASIDDSDTSVPKLGALLCVSDMPSNSVSVNTKYKKITT